MTSSHNHESAGPRVATGADHDNHASHPHGHEHPHGHTHTGPHGHKHGTGWKARLLEAIKPHSHDYTDAVQTAEETSGAGIRAAWVGLAGMAAVTVLQTVIVAFSGSIALLADVVHSVGHLVTTIPLIIAFRIGQRPPTKRFPFGFR